MAKVSALGLDIGRRRIGVAGCDGLGLLATGLATLERRNFREDVAALERLIQEREATVLVVGMPYNAQGEMGSQAQQVQRYAERLSRVLGLPVEYMDERCTSVAAEEMLRQSGRSPSHDKGAIDRKAAALILQEWLDQRRSSTVPPR